MTTITNPAGVTDEALAQYLAFLDGLREAGVTNMFGARPYLQDEYPALTDGQAAKMILAFWMATFADRPKEGD